MALSIYPRAIPLFPTHRNLLDDVDAAHINNIQRELTAITTVLGTNPEIYNDMSLAQVSTSYVDGDEGGIDPDINFSGLTRYYDPKITPKNHGSVSNRLDSIERGDQTHCFKLQAFNIGVSPSSVAISTRPRLIRFPKPAAFNDPFSMYNGAGVSLRKNGYYTFHAHILYTLQGNASQNDGVYVAAIDRDGTWIDGEDRRTLEPGGGVQSLNVTLAGFFNRGDRISFLTAHSSAVAQRIRRVSLAGHLVRETV